MDALPYATPPRWWAPNLRPFFVRAIWPVRTFMRQRWQEGVRTVDVRGVEHLREAAERDQGVVIVCNHAHHSDPFVMLRAGDALGRPFYYMVAWQSFTLLNPLACWVIQRHGSFSVNREGSDLRAFRQAVEIVRAKRNPLVIFAEGEVYHHAERLAPFRQGVAAIALAALRRAPRPVVCVPAAIHYRYIDDPTPELLPLVDAMERKVLGMPSPGRALAERLAHLAETVLTQREREFAGRVETGTFARRAAALTETILHSLEARYGAPPEGTDVPDRVTRIRRGAIRQKEGSPPDSSASCQAAHDLEDANVAVQLYSYTDDYASDEPSIEHLAEIVDKFEEDILGVTTAGNRGRRRATIRFGPAIAAAPFQEKSDGIRALTEALEHEVQGMLNERIAEGRGATRAVPVMLSK